MATKIRQTGASKGSNKRQTKPSSSSSTSKSTPSNSKKSNPRPKPTEQKSKPRTTTNVKAKKPPHLRYTEAQLKVPHLNGIRPAGVQKPPNRKKGKQFVDDGAGMKTILAMVMAEKEGNIESKMMRARQMEEIREARRMEAEKRAEGKKQGLEERKEEIRKGRKKGMRETDGGVVEKTNGADGRVKKPKKKVSFG